MHVIQNSWTLPAGVQTRSGLAFSTLGDMRPYLSLLCVASLCLGADPSWEEKFRAIPSPQNLRDYMQRLSARPHHVGSPYDKDNAEWIAAKLKGWGFDTSIENF